MSNTVPINRYILEQLQNGKLDKDIAIQILKYLNSKGENTAELDKRIAIVGMAGRFPEASDLNEFWNNIYEGKCCVRSFPSRRKKDLESLIKRVTGDELEYETCGYLDEIDKFDYEFFGLSPNEAVYIEPVQRLFLETAVEAIEDSGIGYIGMYGKNTGVFVGRDHTSGREFRELAGGNNLLALVGTYTGFLASRISYIMNLKGPCMVVDTACSSGLVALHNACKSLIAGECETAIAAGVNLFSMGLAHGAMGDVRSKAGVTRTFDNRADGTMWGESVGVVLLKPLKRAIEDRDNIHAVILGSAINCDGASNGITAPNAEAQKEVLIRAWEEARVDVETIAYIEAHGTGTVLGDPIEIKGITNAFRKYTNKKQFCGIGSVKANIGHTVATSGIASLIKMVLALKNRKLPGNPSFEVPNKFIRFHRSPVYVNYESTEWESNGIPRRCGVSSFGFSGTNCHVVLEEASGAQEEHRSYGHRPYIFVLSAKSRDILLHLIEKYKKYLKDSSHADIGDICYTASTGRGHYNCRLAFVIRNINDLKTRLEQLDLTEFNNCSESGIYYNEFKIVSDKKETEENFEIHESKARQLSSDACCKVQEISDLDPDSPEYAKLLEEICNIYTKGGEVEWDELYRGEKRNRLSLPTYPFKRTRCWLEGDRIEDTAISNGVENFYRVDWIEKEVIESSSVSKGTTIILKGNGEIADRIAGTLSEGVDMAIEVSRGKKYMRVDGQKYIIDGSAGGYDKLLSEEAVKKVDRIVHMLSLESDSRILDTKSLEEKLLWGVESVFNLLKAISNNDMRHSIELILVTEYANKVSGQEEFINPVNAALLGIGKVVGAEHPNIKCRAIDIDRGINEKMIVREINSNGDMYIYQSAYRRGKRYIEMLDALDMQQVGDCSISLSEGKVYIITGGLGGIGLEIAKYLASKSKITLIFINRSPMPEREQWDAILKDEKEEKLIRRILGIRAIEKNGSTVSCYSADVASEIDMVEVISGVRQKYGKINGIIHSAGIFDEGLIINKSPEMFRNILSSKIQGTWVIDSLTKNDDLDFLILFSSIASLAGIEGQGGYTAANAFLDAYEAYRNKLGKRTITINWGTWRETGGAVEYGTNVDGMFKTLSNAEGREAFEKIICKRVSRVIAARVNTDSQVAAEYRNLPFEISDRVKSVVNKALKQAVFPGNTAQAPVQVSLRGRTDGNYTFSERQIAQIWGEIMGFKEFDIYDNFYELGGDSRIAIRIANKINSITGKNIVVADILKYPTIIEFAQLMGQETSETGGFETVYSNIEALPPKDYYPVSSAQRRLFVIDSIDDLGISYNIPMVMRIEGNIDIRHLETVFGTIVKRHEVLRTSFKMIDGEPVQIVEKDINFKIDTIEVGEQTDEKHLIEKFIRPFDLSIAPLLRVALVRFSDERYMLLFDMHHIISDEASVDILVREFIELYGNRDLPEMGIQYKDFAVWQNKLLDSEDIKRQEEYWLKRFEGDIPILDLPADYARTSTQNFEGDRIVLEVEDELTDKLVHLSNQTGTTLFMQLLSIYNVLLMKYTGQEKIIVGSPVEGRRHNQLENLIGMFANMIAVVNAPKASMTFKDFLNDVRINLLEAYSNMDYQYERLVEKLDLKRDMSRNPLFDTVFILRTADFPKIELGNIRFIPYAFEITTSKFDITLEVIKNEQGLKLILEYRTSLFKRQSMMRFAQHYINIIKQVVNDPEIKLSDIDILGKEEREHLLIGFNHTEAAYPKDKTIHRIFTEQACKTPGCTAAVYGQEALSYRQLDEKSDILAKVLRGKGVGPGTVAGVMLERSLEMIIGIMGILKAGGAYLPIDPGYPAERVRFMLEDSGVKILLVNSLQIKDYPAYLPESVEIMCLDDESLYNSDGSKLESINGPTDLAYVIYTSGSTGNPKGAMIEHRSVINRLNWMQRKYPLEAGDVILQKTPFTFDVSVWELFWWSMYGAGVCFLKPGGEKDPGAIIEAVEKYGVTVMHFVPSMLNAFLEYVEVQGEAWRLKSLRQVFASGEALTPQQVERFNRVLGKNNGTRLTNLYGPTEATVDVSYFDCPVEETNVVPIGKPIDNTHLYIVDRYNHLCPIGIPGEVCIAGVGVGRGYLNRPELTAEKFVENPFYSMKGLQLPEDGYKRMYRTGDLGRWMPDGNIEYLGRIDHQVKIRGFRIEPGEIESILMQHPQVKETVVIDRGDTSENRYLAAYMVTAAEIPVMELKEYLSEKLPEYMVPSYFIRMESIPLTGNGKIDRKGLPIPEKSVVNSQEYVAPESSAEKKLAGIWMELLNIDSVSVHDNFFSLGGNSIRLIQLFNRIEKEYPGRVKVTDIFAYPTVSKLAHFITSEIDINGITCGSIEFSPEYFSDEAFSQDKEYILKFIISQDRKNKLIMIANKENTGVSDILMSIYIYLLSELTGMKEIKVDTPLDGSDEIFTVQVDFGVVEDTAQLFKLVGDSIQLAKKEKDSTPGSKLSRVDRKSALVSSLFYNEEQSNVKSVVQDLYDIFMGIFSDSEGICILCEYDSTRMNSSKMEELVEAYSELIDNLIDEYRKE